MSDLTEFLLSRLDEDETGEPLYFNVGAGKVAVERHEPSERWRREVQAKRAIVAAVQQHIEGEWEDDPIHERVLFPLAEVYRDHPDFDEDWRP